MSVATVIRITKDTATPMLAAARELMLPKRLNPIIGRSAVNVYRAHLFGVNESRPNKLGGTRTNYYATAARSTHFTILDDDTVLISMSQVGLALRFYGGTVKPKTAKFLTIPVNAKAHGHRAREFDLEIVFGEGGRPIALATKSTRATQVKQNSRGKNVTRQIGRHGEIMFLLVKSATMKPDPTILPYERTVLNAVAADVKEVFDRDIARSLQGSGNPPAGGAS